MCQVGGCGRLAGASAAVLMSAESAWPASDPWTNTHASFCNHRSSAYAAALSGAAAFSPPHSRRASAAGTSPPAMAPRPSGDGKRFGEAAAAGREAGAAADGAAADYASPPAAARRPPPASPSGDWGNLDDRLAVAKGAYDFQNADESSTPVNIRRRSMPSPAPRAASSAASDAGPPPPG